MKMCEKLKEQRQRRQQNRASRRWKNKHNPSHKRKYGHNWKPGDYSANPEYTSITVRLCKVCGRPR